MKLKNDFKQRNKMIQGLRSFKDALPVKIKKVIDKKGHIFSKLLDNWKFIVGEDLFKVCFPKSYKNANFISGSCLIIMVRRGNEIDVEYSKHKIIEKINNFLGKKLLREIKLVTYEDENIRFEEKTKKLLKDKNEKIGTIKNEKIRESLMKLNKYIKKR